MIRIGEFAGGVDEGAPAEALILVPLGEGVEQIEDLASRVPVVRSKAASQPRARPVHLAGQVRSDEAFLATEVRIESGLRSVGVSGDSIDAHRLDALTVEELACDEQHALA